MLEFQVGSVLGCPPGFPVDDLVPGRGLVHGVELADEDLAAEYVVNFDLDVDGHPLGPFGPFEGGLEHRELFLLGYGEVAQGAGTLVVIAEVQFIQAGVDAVGAGGTAGAPLDPGVEQRAEPGGSIGALGHGAAQFRGDTGRVVDVVLEPGSRDARRNGRGRAAGQPQSSFRKEQGDRVGPAGGGIRFTVPHPRGSGFNQRPAGAEGVEWPQFGATGGGIGFVGLVARVGDGGDEPGFDEFREIAAGPPHGQSWAPE